MFDPGVFQRTAVNFAVIVTRHDPYQDLSELSALEMANAAVKAHAEADLVDLLRKAVEACPGGWTLRFAPSWQVIEQLSELNVVVCPQEHIDESAAVLEAPVPDARFFAFRVGIDREHNCVRVHPVDADEWARRQERQQEQADRREFDRPRRAKLLALTTVALDVIKEANIGPAEVSEADAPHVKRHLDALEALVARLTGTEASPEDLLDPSRGFDKAMNLVIMAALAVGISPGYVIYMAEERITQNEITEG